MSASLSNSLTVVSPILQALATSSKNSGEIERKSKDSDHMVIMHAVYPIDLNFLYLVFFPILGISFLLI